MRTPDLYAKVGETFSPRFTLTGADGAPQSFVGADAVTLRLRTLDLATAIYDDVACDFDPAVAGPASYDSPTVINCEPGKYALDFAVHFPGTPPITHRFPNGGPKDDDAYYLVKISA
jgi:hypothetical protein